MSFSAPGRYALDKLQKLSLVTMSVLVVLTFLLTNFQALFWQSSQWLVGSVLPAVVVQLTNEERADLNETPLKRSAVLDAAAKMKAENMAKNQYFAHYAPDGTTPWYWFDKAGYTYAHAGENLAIHFTDSTEVVEAWMDSPTHRKNIVDTKFTEIGVGTAKGTYEGYDTVYVVQLFGTPAVVPVTKSAPVIPSATPTQVPASSELAIAEINPEPEVAAAEVTTEEPRLQTSPSEAETPTVSPEVTLESPESAENTELATNEVSVVEIASDNTVFLESSIVATSSGLAVASVVDESVSEPVSFFAFATQPNTIIQFIYAVLTVLVIGMLIVSLIKEVEKARFIQVAYSVALLLSMGGLYWLHTALTHGAIVV